MTLTNSSLNRCLTIKIKIDEILITQDIKHQPLFHGVIEAKKKVIVHKRLNIDPFSMHLLLLIFQHLNIDFALQLQ